jgi:hypothetical protein
MKNFLTTFLFLINTITFSFAQTEIMLYDDNDFNYASDEMESFDINEDAEILEIVRANCFCKVSYNNLTNQKSASGVCLDLTSRVNMSFTGLSQGKPKNQRKCDKKCSEVAAALTAAEIQAIANCACAAPRPAGTKIVAFSALGARRYSSAQFIGTLVNTAATYQTSCSCPNGWQLDNTHNKCKKALCSTGENTQNQGLGNWGFIWDNTIYQWKKANCTQSQTSAAVCRIRR